MKLLAHCEISLSPTLVNRNCTQNWKWKKNWGESRRVLQTKWNDRLIVSIIISSSTKLTHLTWNNNESMQSWAEFWVRWHAHSQKRADFQWNAIAQSCKNRSITSEINKLLCFFRWYLATIFAPQIRTFRDSSNDFHAREESTRTALKWWKSCCPFHLVCSNFLLGSFFHSRCISAFAVVDIWFSFFALCEARKNELLDARKLNVTEDSKNLYRTEMGRNEWIHNIWIKSKTY